MTSFVDKVLLVDEALAAAAVEHAFGGATALAYAFASPRATDDIDVNIAAPVTDRVPFAGRDLPVIAPTHLAVFKVLSNRAKE